MNERPFAEELDRVLGSLLGERAEPAAPRDLAALAIARAAELQQTWQAVRLRQFERRWQWGWRLTMAGSLAMAAFLTLAIVRLQPESLWGALWMQSTTTAAALGENALPAELSGEEGTALAQGASVATEDTAATSAWVAQLGPGLVVLLVAVLAWIGIDRVIFAERVVLPRWPAGAGV